MGSPKMVPFPSVNDYEVSCLVFRPGNRPNYQELDWNYNMRREMQEIVPGLFLGPYASANRTKCAYLQSQRITHIVCIRHKAEAPFVRANFPDKFKYLVLEIADSVTENILPYFTTVKQFITEALSSGGKVLVHGNAGISRSAALVIAYLMETYRTTFHDAFDFVQRKRFCIYPNEGFARQLMEYEPIYQARIQCESNGWNHHGGAALKRKLEDEGEEEPME